jgi:hypothetical protein
MKYNIRLRQRLKDYAIKHNYRINIDRFLRHQMDLADIGLVEPVCISHTRQTLSRFPEFKLIKTGTYRYTPIAKRVSESDFEELCG